LGQSHINTDRAHTLSSADKASTKDRAVLLRRPTQTAQGVQWLLLLTAMCLAVVLLRVLQVTRDRMMLELDQQYPQYGFAQHKGYGVSPGVAQARSGA
jgi:hypothetical protein